MIVLNPALESVPIEARIASRPAAIDGLTVAFLDNSKLMAGVFLEELASIFEARYAVKVIFDRKPDSSRVVSHAQLQSLAAKAHAIITGVGD